MTTAAYAGVLCGLGNEAHFPDLKRQSRFIDEGNWMMSLSDYSLEDDDQLQPEDTLIDRGVDDILDEGFSPPERPYGGNSFGTSRESLDQLLAEEEQDPASRMNIPFDNDEQQGSDAAERESEFPQRREVGRARAVGLSLRTMVLATM